MRRAIVRLRRADAAAVLVVAALVAASGAMDRAGAAFTATTTTSGTVSSGSFNTCAGTQTLIATADVYVSQFPVNSKNSSTGTSLVISSQTTKNERILVQFDLPVVPAGCTVTGATLQLTTNGNTSGRIILANMLSAAWDQTTVTWNTQPATQGAPASSASLAVAGDQTWDVTSLVQQMLVSGNNGFQLSDQAEGQAALARQSYYSRDSSLNPPKPPTLLVTIG